MMPKEEYEILKYLKKVSPPSSYSCGPCTESAVGDRRPGSVRF